MHISGMYMCMDVGTAANRDEGNRYGEGIYDEGTEESSTGYSKESKITEKTCPDIYAQRSSNKSIPNLQ